ncbi:hypothetical protein V491_07214 [Pseudogymnoascus sp. VKM F-3775]|nr:hypothetical protein V491_07214 [Pseudogymnoascus sp. VKM F-3775]
MPTTAPPFSVAAAVASPSATGAPFPLYSPAGSIAQSPMGTNYPSTFSPSVLSSVGQHPPPIKKKLSLSAYNAMRKKLPEASKSEPPKPDQSKEIVQPEPAQPEPPKAEVEQESKSLPPPPLANKDAPPAQTEGKVAEAEHKVSETPVPIPTPTVAADTKTSEASAAEAASTSAADDKQLINGNTVNKGDAAAAV